MIPRKSFRFYKGELKDILSLVFAGKVSEGKYIELFEKKFAEYIGTQFAIATCSGRNGMDLLLDSLGLNEGDEILLPAYTLGDLIYIIKDKGLVPKLVDIEEDSFNINPDLIESEITDKTRVIIATHMFGLSCNIAKILDIARMHNLRVIEDCAHAAGAEFKGQKLGSFAKAGFFSFESNKPINTFGGGMITTNDAKINSLVRDKIKNYPETPRKVLSKVLFTYIEHWILKSFLYRALNALFMFKTSTKIISKFYLSIHNQARVEYSRFTSLQAFLGLRQLSYLDQCNEKRSKLAGELSERLSEKVIPQRSQFQQGRIFYFYTVRIIGKKDLESVRRKLLIKGIDAGIRSEVTDNCALSIGNTEGYTIVAEIFNRVLQLPIHDQLRQRDIDYIVRAVNEI
ncbi:MAG: aminotransferase class I/II-fold pyridoxal phosphate-dependent enzyme [Candidatus Omnitrophica bacterium]|nr:aminotransferase class I/II-fold pyridoxal phosphate-dependent enzyme [Candidatus Omnitrophota bacterium]